MWTLEKPPRVKNRVLPSAAINAAFLRGNWGLNKSAILSFSYPEPFLRAARRGALAKSITGYHKNMVRKQCPVLELANQMPVRNMDLARAPRRTARKKGSGYENAILFAGNKWPGF